MENTEDDEKKLNILIIDDSQSQRLLLQTFLKSFNVTEAGSGIDALKILVHETFDLIICDFEMPEIQNVQERPFEFISESGRGRSGHDVDMVTFVPGFKFVEFNSIVYPSGNRFDCL